MRQLERNIPNAIWGICQGMVGIQIFEQVYAIEDKFDCSISFCAGVKNLIERCLQLHMSRKEVVSVLSREANVMPAITELLWQRLEEENQDFFEVYYIRLALKEQIQRFNELLKQQAVLMGKIQSSGVAPIPVSNGLRSTQLQQNASFYAFDQTLPSMRPDNFASSIPGSLVNGFSPLQTPISSNLSNPPRAIDGLPDTLHVQNSNSRLMHGLNGGIVKSKSGYPSDSPIFYGSEPNLGEAHGLSMEDGTIAAFGGMQASSQSLNETLLGVNGPYGQLGQIPKIFSLPDLAYPNALENYTDSTFMTDTENFLDSQDRADIPDENKVAITESYSNYEEFGSE